MLDNLKVSRLIMRNPLISNQFLLEDTFIVENHV